MACLAGFCGAAGAQFSLAASRCHTDEEITADDRAPVERAALEFAQRLLGNDPASAYPKLAAETRRTASRESFVGLAEKAMKPFALKDLRVAHIYVLTTTAVGNSTQQTYCSTVARGDTSKPEGRVYVTEKMIPKQAYVVLEADAINNTFGFVLWLEPEDDEWRILHFQFQPITMAGKSADDIWSLARREEGQQHGFNAYVLSLTALQLAARGSNFHLGIEGEMQRKLRQLERPAALAGPPPFAWQLGSETFRVLNVSPIGIAGKLYLVISHEIESWSGDQDADRHNRRLIAGFREAHPEYSSAFAGLVAEAHEHGSAHGYRTVFEN